MASPTHGRGRLPPPAPTGGAVLEGDPSRPREVGGTTFRRWFANPWVGFFGTVFTVMGVALSLYFFYAGQRNRELVFYTHPVRTEIVRAGEVADLRVSYRERQVTRGLSAVQVAIWNSGAEAIRPTNVLKPVAIVARPSVPVLEAKVLKATRPDVVGLTLDPTGFAAGRVSASWNILEKNDGAAIQIIYEGAPSVEFDVEGVIEGQPRVTRSIPYSKIQTAAEQFRDWRRDRWLGALAALLCAAVACSLLRRVFQTLREKPLDRLELAIQIGLLLCCVAAAAMSVWQFRRFTSSSPPFVF